MTSSWQITYTEWCMRSQVDLCQMRRTYIYTYLHIHTCVHTYFTYTVTVIYCLAWSWFSAHTTELSATLKPHAWLRHTPLIPFNQEVGRVWKHELTSHTYHICTCCIVVGTRFTYYVEHFLLYIQVDCH